MTAKQILSLIAESWIQLIHASYRANPEAFNRVRQAIDIEHQEYDMDMSGRIN